MDKAEQHGRLRSFSIFLCGCKQPNPSTFTEGKDNTFSMNNKYTEC